MVMLPFPAAPHSWGGVCGLSKIVLMFAFVVSKVTNRGAGVRSRGEGGFNCDGADIEASGVISWSG